MGVFQRHVILANIEMMGLYPGKHLSRRLHVVRDNHKLHIRPDFFHFPHAVDPVLLIDKKLRAPGVFPAPHVDDAEIFPAVFIGIILGLHLKPPLHLVDLTDKVRFVLHIPVNQSIVLHMAQPLVPAADIAAVL